MDLAFFRRAKNKIVAVLDVTSAGVVVGIVERSGSGSRILSAVPLTLPSEERTRSQSISRLSTLAQEAGKKAIEALAKGTAKSAVTEVVVIVHAPWAHSVVTKAATDYPADTKVTESAMSDLAKKALASAGGLDKRSLIEASVIRSELNGYPTANPEGKMARSLLVYAMATECDQEFSKEIGSAVRTLFPGAKILWRSSTRELCAVLSDLNIAAEDYVIADIESDATDFIVVEGGVPTRHLIAEIGLRTMMDRIAPGAPPEGTLATIRHIMHDQCDEASCEEVAANMAKAEPDFARQFGEVFGKDLPKSKLPPTMILLERESGTEWLSRFFTRIDFSQFTTTQQPFTVLSLGQGQLLEKARVSAPETSDISVSLAAAFVNSSA